MKETLMYEEIVILIWASYIYTTKYLIDKHNF